MFHLLLLLPSSPSPKKPGGGPRNVHAPCAPRCRSQRAQSSPLAGLPASDIFLLPPRGPSSSGTPELFRRSSFLEPASSCHGASAGPEWGCCEAAAARGLTGLGICPQVIASLIPPRRTCPSPATRHPKPRGPIHRHVGPQLNPHKPLPSTRSGGGRGGPRGPGKAGRRTEVRRASTGAVPAQSVPVVEHTAEHAARAGALRLGALRVPVSVPWGRILRPCSGSAGASLCFITLWSICHEGASESLWKIRKIRP